MKKRFIFISFFLFLLTLFFHFVCSFCPKSKTVKIGILTQDGHPPDRMGAFLLAKLMATQKSSLNIQPELWEQKPNFRCLPEMTINHSFAKVNRSTTLPQIAKWIIDNRYDGIFQFIDDLCDYEAAMAGALNVAFFAPGCSNVQLSDKALFPTFARTNSPISKAVKSIISLLHRFSWSKFSLVSSLQRKWKHASEVLKQVAVQEKIIIKHEKYIKEEKSEFSKSVLEIIESTSSETRIYVLMASMLEIVDFTREMDNRNIANSGEYVIICVSDKFVKKFEVFYQNIRVVNDKYNNVTISNSPSFAERSMLFIAAATPNPTVYQAFGLAVCQQGYNGICNSAVQKPVERSIMLQNILTVATFYTYDIVMMFFKAIDNILQRNDTNLDGKKILKEILDKSFKSINGLNVYMDINGDAEGNFTVSCYNKSSNGHWSIVPVAYFVQNPDNSIPKFTMFPDQKIPWILGHPPTSEPKCGFASEKCRLELNVLALSICISMILLLGLIILVAVRYWVIEQKLSSLLWKVDFKDVMITNVLPEYDNNKQRTCKNIDNHYSFLIADDSEIRKKQKTSKQLPKTFTKIGSYKGMIVSIKFINHKSIELTRKFRQEMQFFKDMNQENLNRIIGVCIDPPNISILTLYCSRGSLKDILSNKDIYLDDIFVASLLFDLVKGMIYLHDSQIVYHGNLRTSKCLVDSRWILQISGFGLHSIRYVSTKDSTVWPHSVDAEKYYYKLLWKSPEHLKEPYPMRRGSQKGDIYSFAIIFHELTHQSGPWGVLYKPGNAAEIIRKLKSESVGEGGPIRPIIDEILVPQFVKECLNDCWDDVPEKRPDFKFVRVILKPLLKGLRSNIFDNMLLIMEKYAKNLEVLVEERTWQLIEEKKKIERLLLRMLPKSVTEQLKVGQAVIPEHYSCVTIYFSDIVGFTSLSASSTPMEVVQMLNDLYTLFDSILIEYDVYKVETIGDAYMVVSGLPTRNDDIHVGEIASLSLHLLNAIKSFVIRHRPNETLKLRIGLHSGPCVAGVVGLKMPRYCLFGDTVNTASRMEATGEALKIHTSSDTKILLDSLGGYYLTERGIIEVKGKGGMVTYFLEKEDSSVRIARIAKRNKSEFKSTNELVDNQMDYEVKRNSSEENIDANEFLRKISLSSHSSMNTSHSINVLPTVDFRKQIKLNQYSTHISQLYESSSSWRSLSYPTKPETNCSFKKQSENQKNGSVQLIKESLNHFSGDPDSRKSLLYDS